jgi:choline dehydrogenase
VNGFGLIGQFTRWLLNRPSIMTIGPVLGYAFCKSDASLDRPDYLLNFTPGSMGPTGISGIEREPGMTIAAIQLRPESTGYVRARSNDPLAAPAVQPNYLSAATDGRVLLAGMKMIRRFAATPPLTDHMVGETSPGAHVRSDAELMEFARDTGGSGHHLVGTCRMGPDGDAGAVVDTKLRLRGFSGLRISDCSVMPTITSGNTNAPVLMIAEKAADLILGRA